MKRPSSLPIWVQVAVLAVLAVVMSQAVAFAVVLLAPDPRPAGFSLNAAAEALQGRPAETTDGRRLKRRIVDAPPHRSETDVNDPVGLALTDALARQLNVSPAHVLVSVHRPRRRGGEAPPRGPGGRAQRGDVSMIFVRPGPTGDEAPKPPPAPTGADGQPIVIHRSEDARSTRFTLRREGGDAVSGARVQQFTVLADRLSFAPFSAAVRQPDGRWAVVEPPRGWLAPWQKNLLLGLGISMLLLAPLVWWMARRLTRPIRVFADAAERLGANPDAEPLKATGPTEVRTAIVAFNDMQASLRDHVRKQTQTVAAIAHDLRTPLTRLRFRAEQAPEGVRDRMAADIEEMDALIAQAMAYVRGEQPPERRERFDLTDLVRDCAGGFTETGADVAFEGPAALPVLADPAALRRALANLIGNAVKYGGGARVRAIAEDGQAVVTVEDEGPGLADDDLEAVFEPFYRGERSRSRETGGAGLGLTVARQAARAHGGDVALANRDGGGLTARLSVPLAD
ncbi:MAG: HAMP domain-containing protein [Brevundimonas sp.]|nr:MAG: HAMP domain-containing protein [Brevundimonas sp.]